MENTIRGEVSTKINSSIDEILNSIEHDREREIIARRFGLNGSRETLEQIGELLNITRERVRQIEAQALTRLRHPSVRRKLRDYLGDW